MEMRLGSKLKALNITRLGRIGRGHRSNNGVHGKNGSDQVCPTFPWATTQLRDAPVPPDPKKQDRQWQVTSETTMPSRSGRFYMTVY